MRKYEKKETGTLTELYCNRCGKKLHVENGIAMEGVLPVDIAWGYFSKKIHSAINLTCVKIVTTRSSADLPYLLQRKLKRNCCSGKKCVLR